MKINPHNNGYTILYLRLKKKKKNRKIDSKIILFHSIKYCMFLIEKGFLEIN